MRIIINNNSLISYDGYMGRAYTVLVGLVTVFALYYQYLTTGFSVNPQLLNWFSTVVLLVSGYSYFFKKKLWKKKIWNVIFKLLMLNLVISFIFQIVPGSYLGDFSLLNGYLVTNIFVYLIGVILLFPLYYASYILANNY